MTESPPIDEEGKNYAFGKKFKYTLDSDEEDDEVAAEKYNVMNDEALECIEKSTIDFDGDIKITPFNMDEELETGHFDKEGTYIFKKKNEDIRDNWLDNIDWNGINAIKNDDKQPHKTNNKDEDKDDSEDSEDDDNLLSDLRIKENYRKIIELIEPGETIRKAIQRYGKQCNNNNNKKGQKRKFQTKDSKNNEKQQQETEPKQNESKEKMLKLISIADQILQTGDMDIYERTYEQFNLHLNKSNNQQQQQQSNDEDDMFGDDFDVNKVSTAATSISSSTLDTNNSTQWEYKWEDSDEAKIYGPYSSEDMLAWVNQGYFDQGIFVRRTDSEDAKFYNSKRIDFELYV